MRTGNREIVRVLIEHGAHVASKAIHERWNENYVSNCNDPTVDIENCEYVKYAQYTPLYFACKNGHSEIVLDLLLQPGEMLKDVLEEASNGNGNQEDAKRYEHVWEALTQIVKLLVMYNADYAACVSVLFS